jgi:hypothetical protein
MFQNPDYPLQTSNNCVAFSYWVAMKESLEISDPFREFNITVQQIQECIGAPASVGKNTVVALLLKYPNQIADAYEINKYSIERFHYPCVWNSWYNGTPHAFCTIPSQNINSVENLDITVHGGSKANKLLNCYDPALGTLVPLDIPYDQCGSEVVIVKMDSTAFPYKNWFFRFKIIRNFYKFWISI